MWRSSRSSASHARQSHIAGEPSGRTISPRSKLALTSGFIIAAAAALLMGGNQGPVFAEDDSVGSFWRSEMARKASAVRQAVGGRTAAPAPARVVAAPATRPAAYPVERATKRQQPQPRGMTAYAPVQQPRPAQSNNPFWFFTQTPPPPAPVAVPQHVNGAGAIQNRALAARKRAQTKTATAPAALPRVASTRMVCVRLCDGFFFPAPEGMSANDAGCAAVCPNAPTRLYSMRSDSITDAVSRRDGASYAKLPVALSYTKAREQTCSCGAVEPRAAIMADATLRRGDRFMTEKGFLIYQGQGQRQAGSSTRSFTPLAQTRGLPARERNLLSAMERVSVAPSSQRVAETPASGNHVALAPPQTESPVAIR